MRASNPYGVCDIYASGENIINLFFVCYFFNFIDWMMREYKDNSYKPLINLNLMVRMKIKKNTN